MREPRKYRSPWLEIHSSRHIDVRLLPEGRESVGVSALRLDLHTGDGNSWIIQAIGVVTRQRRLVFLEDIVDVGVPAVEDRVAHGGGGIPHNAEGFQMAMVRIVDVRDEDVPHVVQVAVEGAVRREDARLDHVPQDVDPLVLRQLDRPSIVALNIPRVDGVEDAIAPDLQVVHVLPDLVHLPVEILQRLIGDARRPCPTRHQAVQLGEVGLLDGLPPLDEPVHALHVVGEALEVVAGDDLLVHVVEELAAAVLVDDGAVRLEGVDEVPVPVVEVYAEVLAEVGEAVLLLQVRRGVVQRDLDRGLKVFD